MADLPPPPRLDSSAPTQPGYAPISWTAVASLGVAGLFVFVLLVFGYFAVVRRQPLNMPPLLILPAFAVVLAFAARRQIEGAEGTRTGLRYANAGWWIAVVGGLGFVAYLLGIDFAIRREAEREFHTWAAALEAGHPADPADPKFAEACYMVLPPGLRVQQFGGQEAAAKNPARLADVFREAVEKFRTSDVARIVSRSGGGQVQITPQGVHHWGQTTAKITCTLTAKMVSPEGDHLMTVDMEAVIDPAGRAWQVVVPSDGRFIKARVDTLTRYGRLVNQLELSGRKFTDEFLALEREGRTEQAYDGFVRPDGDPAAARTTAARAAGLVALCGAVTAPAVAPPGYQVALAGSFFTLPGGRDLTEDDRERFVGCWERGRIGGPGSYLQVGVEVFPFTTVQPSAVTGRYPVEIRLPEVAEGSVGVARGRLVITTSDPALLAELTAARADRGPASADVPDAPAMKPIRWRVVRFESDLKPSEGPSRGPPSSPGH